MDEAIKRLEELKAEYEEGLKVTFEPADYYRRLEGKLAGVEEALERLRR